ncbi:D-malate degradation protein R [Serratia quinivorans]|uniref:LysR family transcriptional regulator n=1 Tax=Serratia quinivorans TaxID=137545 RepID=UPI0021793462|nr:LysR family transcriptional regulator [Serratia quinivorans]CAI0722896.1 D-malate degradation protein R [Serratia quinivorans]CAI0746699.1 D-malate degradation protein R [Serratia quinivorans]CAI1537701.1 D-malate degradation protein R [Serratia quinivorans]CAI2042464.1 D-malate degradation protein R [Serratia quinivorans]CAI2407253.1 D-malate degradation protein R [Serratia quinivorans]
MQPNFSDFASFIAVARYKSFREAGDELGLSPSAMSHSIKQLEQRLKVRLFNRTTRSVALTEAGLTLFERLRPVFDEINTILDEMNCFRDAPMGTLKINTSRLASRLFLLPLIAGFSRKYPDIKVEITTDDKLVDIVQQEFDAGIRLNNRVEKDMITVPIGPKIKLVVVATPEYLKHHPAPKHPCELIHHQSVVFRFQSGRPYLWEFESPSEKLEVAPVGNIMLDDMDSALEAVLCGAGLGYLYYEQVKEHLQSGKLVKVLDDWLPERPSLQLYYPNRQYMSGPLRAFIDYMKETQRSAENSHQENQL